MKRIALMAALALCVLAIAGGTAVALNATLDHGSNQLLCPEGDRAGAVFIDMPGNEQARDGVSVFCATPTRTSLPTVASTATVPATATRTATPTRTATATSTPIPGADARCRNTTPLGAIPPAVEEWCFLPQTPARVTHIITEYGWIDDFNHGAQHGVLGNGFDGYYGDVTGDGCHVIHFRHNDHWMSDAQGATGQWPTQCAAWLRPNLLGKLDASGRLVIEFEVAGPIAGTRDGPYISDSWPEITISTAVDPARQEDNWWGSAFRRNGTYFYEAFPRAWTFGCRMQQSRHPICALYNAGEGHAGGADRQWEINQNGGDVRYEFGGDPSVPGLQDVWKSCDSTQDPDTLCRNLFRLEFAKDATGNHVLKIFVNGTRYYEAGLIDAKLDNIFNNVFYVFFASFAFRIGGDVSQPDPTIRFHWDHIAINP